MKAFIVRISILLVIIYQAVLLGQEITTQITIINKSDFDIKGISIASESSDTWESIELKDDILLPNDSLEIFIELGEECSWDFLVTDQDDNEYVINFDLCKEKTIKIEIVKEDEEEEDNEE